ncbi:hypothetical protein [Shewanella polaris]|uniref:Uncharacterized protein n=1 Tax=Shewanella polaris TaxID=2588449 RepID=A0A4Y5YDK1_9GAMM|nr:hypothetical protein [Shewanella polaris]QDE30832.1 hypothetical protein FH971_07535 [Shewanella polaris]
MQEEKVTWLQLLLGTLLLSIALIINYVTPAFSLFDGKIDERAMAHAIGFASMTVFGFGWLNLKRNQALVIISISFIGGLAIAKFYSPSLAKLLITLTIFSIVNLFSPFFFNYLKDKFKYVSLAFVFIAVVFTSFYWEIHVQPNLGGYPDLLPRYYVQFQLAMDLVGIILGLVLIIRSNRQFFLKCHNEAKAP